MNRWTENPVPATALETLVIVTICAVLFVGLLIAGIVGEQRRCDTLRAQHSATYTAYCQGGTR